MELNAALVERGPVLAGKDGRLFCLVVLELEGEGRCLVKVEALDNLLHWVPGCKFSLPASDLRPLPSLLDWDHTALLGPLHLLHLPDGTRIKIIKSEQIGQVLTGTSCIMFLLELQVYNSREVLDAPEGELISVSGMLLSREEEEEGKVKLVLGEEGEEVALYLASASLPPALLPGLRLEVTSVTRVISKKGRSYLRSTPLTRLELVLSAPPVTTSSPRMLVSLDTFHTLTIEVKWSTLIQQEIFLLQAVCVGCASPIRGGACSYAGCNVQEQVLLKHNH